MNRPSTDVLIVVAKAPLAGVSKTRLTMDGAHSPADAAQLAGAFLLDTLETCRAVAGARLLIAFAPAGARRWFEQAAPQALLVEQPEGDLGERMQAAFERAFELGAQRALAVGADVPHLSATELSRGFDALDSCDVVLGAVSDGGYYAIGMRRLHVELLRDIPWSTARVLAQTLERAASRGLRVARLTPTFDVDTPEDLARLRRLIEVDALVCPHTRGALARIDARRGVT